MFIDSNNIEKCGNQTVHVPKLNLTPLGLAKGNPVENAARGRKIDADRKSVVEGQSV